MAEVIGCVGRYAHKNGRRRECEYTEDEAVHLERINKTKRNSTPSNIVRASTSGSAGRQPISLSPAPSSPIKSPTKRRVTHDDESDLSSDSSDDDFEEDIKRAKKARLSKGNTKSPANAGGAGMGLGPGPGPGSGSGNSVTPARIALGLPASASPTKARKIDVSSTMKSMRT
jgi:hypothetical protein